MELYSIQQTFLTLSGTQAIHRLYLSLLPFLTPLRVWAHHPRPIAAILRTIDNHIRVPRINPTPAVPSTNLPAQLALIGPSSLVLLCPMAPNTLICHRALGRRRLLPPQGVTRAFNPRTLHFLEYSAINPDFLGQSLLNSLVLPHRLVSLNLCGFYTSSFPRSLHLKSICTLVSLFAELD